MKRTIQKFNEEKKSEGKTIMAQMYNITKLSTDGKEKNYGIWNYDDMLLITRGYKQEPEMPTMYNRNGSKWFFLVEEVK